MTPRGLLLLSFIGGSHQLPCITISYFPLLLPSLNYLLFNYCFNFISTLGYFHFYTVVQDSLFHQFICSFILFHSHMNILKPPLNLHCLSILKPSLLQLTLLKNDNLFEILIFLEIFNFEMTITIPTNLFIVWIF